MLTAAAVVTAERKVWRRTETVVVGHHMGAVVAVEHKAYRRTEEVAAERMV